MGTVTYYVALAFMKSDGGGEIVAYDPKEARSSGQAIRIASLLAKLEGHWGAIAFSRTGDPALRDFEDEVILKKVGEVKSPICRSSDDLGRHRGAFRRSQRRGKSAGL